MYLFFLNIIDGSNLIVLLGFVDSLVYIFGGGGEGGFYICMF